MRLTSAMSSGIFEFRGTLRNRLIALRNLELIAPCGRPLAFDGRSNLYREVVTRKF